MTLRNLKNNRLRKAARTAPSQASWFQRLLIACGIFSLQGCAVLSVADAAVTVVATGVKVTAKAVGAAASAVIP